MLVNASTTWRLPVLLYLLVFVLSTAGLAQNLLKNPGFETVAKNGVPVSWSREYNAILTGPFSPVADSHSGKRAVRMLTEEWNYLRPQYLTQTVKLPAGAKVCVLSAYAKGQGLVNLVFQFRKGGKPLETSKQDMGFGVFDLPKESLNAFGLEQDYQPYTATAAVPAGADAVLVKVGNTVDLFDRLNVWGKAYLDDVSLVVKAKADPAAKAFPVTKTVTVPAGQQDIAPSLRITMQPAAYNVAALVDGDPATSNSFAAGLERAGNATLLLPKPLAIRSVQLYLLGNVESLTIRGDADGDGRYEILLARADNITGSGWVTLATANKPVRSLRVQPVKGNGLYTGFRGTNAFASEIKVLVPQSAASAAELAKWAAFRHQFPPAQNVPAISLAPTNLQITPLATPRFRKMVCADLWMWGANADKPDAPLPDFANNATFKQTVAGVKALGVTWVEIDLTNASSNNLMPWPSKVCTSTKQNILKATIDALHKEGFKVVVELIHNITPFEPIKWHYPGEETSRYPGMKQYPSVTHGLYFRDNWLIIEDEIMACGADGVGLSTDEAQYRGSFMETFPANDPARRLYRDRFGYDLPAKEEDTLKFRQWIVMRHEGLSDTYGYVSRVLRSKYRNIYLNTMWMVPTSGGSNVTEIQIPWDVMAARGGITELGSDYMGPYGIRMAAAANGWRRATMVYNGDMWPHPPLPAIHFYGSVLWSWMYGAGSSNFWRYNYVADAGHAPALTGAYRIADELDALGAYDAKPAQKIALLSSRASLDWWQVKSWWGTRNGAAWDRGLEGQRGWFADEATFNLLQQNGYVFDWKYLDQPTQLQDLSAYKALLVPFAYSVSKEAADKVKAAAAAGATVILLDGHQGETDAWGEPYPTPIFKELVDSGKAILVKDDILAWGATDTFTEKISNLLNTTLGADNPLTLNRYNKHIDATVHRKSAREYFLYTINWEQTPSVIDLGVSVPAGSYQVYARDENQWNRVSLNGKDLLSEKDLAKFRLTLPAETPYVFYIKQAAIDLPAAAVPTAGRADTWLGVDENWGNLDNWSTGAPPKGEETTLIPAGAAHYPLLTGSETIPGALQIAAGVRVCSTGSVKLKPGQLILQPGGELWLGVVRKGDEIIDVAVKLTGPIDPAVTPAITPTPLPEKQPGVVTRLDNPVGPALPAGTPLVNIARFAKIKTEPYMTMARNLVDQDEILRTMNSPEGGTPARANRYEFHYDQPQTIATIRWAVPGGPWILLADTTGNGQYTQVLRMDLEGKVTNPGGVWQSRCWLTNTFWPPVKAYGIALVNPAGAMSIYDFQILTSEANPPFPLATALEPGVAPLAAGAALTVPDPPVEQQIMKGFHIEPWMFNIEGWLRMDKAKRPPLSEYKPFADYVAEIKRLHGNTLNMWPPKIGSARGPRTYEMDMMWPSQYDKWTIDEDALTAVCDAFHKAGITLGVMDRCPYPKALEDFPKTATRDLPAPYIDRRYREYLAGVVREEVKAGAAIVGSGYDEEAFTWQSTAGEGLPNMISDPKSAGLLTRKTFEEQYHAAIPDGPADTEAWRKWIVYTYDSFASFIKDGTDAAKATNPKVLTKTPVTVLDMVGNRRIDYGVAHDIIGHTANLDLFRASGYESNQDQGHYVAAASTKYGMAANKTRGTDSLHNNPWAWSGPEASPGYYLETSPQLFAAPPMSAVMNGGKLPLYWRQDHIYDGGYDKYVVQVYGMLDTLSAWGMKNATVPRSIMVLDSRASQDWWQVRQRYNPAGNPLDQTRGFLCSKWLLETLFTNAYSFDMYYLEHPEDFANQLPKYDLVILPFAYSIKQSTYDLLAKAAANGTKFILLDRQGETDEWGNPYPAPLFRPLIDSGKVTFIGDDVTKVGHYPDFLDRFTGLLDKALGAKKLLYLNDYGNDVEMTCLEKNPQERFVCLINWTDRPIEVDAGVTMPDGQYQVQQRDMESINAMTISGKTTVSAADLRKFRVPLKSWDIRVLYIHPQG